MIMPCLSVYDSISLRVLFFVHHLQDFQCVGFDTFWTDPFFNDSFLMIKNNTAYGCAVQVHICSGKSSARFTPYSFSQD